MRLTLILIFFSVSVQAQNFKVYFDTDKSNIKSKYFLVLDSAAQIAKSANQDFVISCHCDNRADSTYNYHLSLRRAKSVQQYLKTKGVQSSMKVVGNGESNPSFANNETERHLNRRCDVKLKVDDEQTILSNIDFENIQPGTLLALDGLEFVGNQAVPNYYSMPVLYELLEIMTLNHGLEIFLRGHVCCGNDMPLSEARAKAVHDFLIENGIEGKRMSYKGYSNLIPLVKEVDDATEQRNRRVEMQVTKNNLDAKSAVDNQTDSIFAVRLREIEFKNNTKYPTATGEYNLNLLADMIASSNGYAYRMLVYSPNSRLKSQRRSYIEALFRRKGINPKKASVIPSKNNGRMNVDMLTLEVKPVSNE